jgi:four helix bundle protein
MKDEAASQIDGRAHDILITPSAGIDAMGLESHRDLLVWQKSMDLVVRCYELSARFPRDELFGLTSQLRRAAVSIPANISEGHGRSSTGAFLNHLSIAHGSVKELETHLLIAERLKYVTEASANDAVNAVLEVGRMLRGLRRSIERQEEGRKGPNG